MAKTRKAAAPKPAEATRASVTFPPDLYRQLETIARRKKVSVAWVVRDAAEHYVGVQDAESSTARQ
jgi:predicted transcriptional regulator